MDIVHATDMHQTDRMVSGLANCKKYLSLSLARRHGATAFDCALNNKTPRDMITKLKEFALFCVDLKAKVCASAILRFYA